MHIIQIQTIGAWKGAQEQSGKPCSCYLVHSHAFYKEWEDISRKCVAIINHKRVVDWVNNYTKMKYMLGKHDAWLGAMVWPHCALVKSWEGFIYVVMHALHKSNHHRGSSMLSRGKSPRLKTELNRGLGAINGEDACKAGGHGSKGSLSGEPARRTARTLPGEPPHWSTARTPPV